MLKNKIGFRIGSAIFCDFGSCENPSSTELTFSPASLQMIRALRTASNHGHRGVIKVSQYIQAGNHMAPRPS